MKRDHSVMLSDRSRFLTFVVLATLAAALGGCRVQKPKAPTLFHKETRYSYGFLDKTGKLVIPAIYDGVGNFSEGLAPVRTGGKWGYIDTKGQVVIRPEYDYAFGFHEGLATVRTSTGKYGFIDRTGKMVIPATFDFCNFGFSEGLAAVRVGKRWGFVDKTGNMAIPCCFVLAADFHEGLAAVQEAGSGTVSYVDKNGDIVIRTEFEACAGSVDPVVSMDEVVLAFCDFREGLAPASGTTSADRRLDAYIDHRGRVRWLPSSTGSFSDGLAPYSDGNGRCGYMDKSGRPGITARFEYAFDFSEGLATVDTTGAGGSCGVIDRTGKWVVKPVYDSIDEFSEGLAYCCDSSQNEFFIDRNGKKVFALQPGWYCGGPAEESGFRFESKFTNGLVPVQVSRQVIVPGPRPPHGGC